MDDAGVGRGEHAGLHGCGQGRGPRRRRLAPSQSIGAMNASQPAPKTGHPRSEAGWRTPLATRPSLTQVRSCVETLLDHHERPLHRRSSSGSSRAPASRRGPPRCSTTTTRACRCSRSCSSSSTTCSTCRVSRTGRRRSVRRLRTSLAAGSVSHDHCGGQATNPEAVGRCADSAWHAPGRDAIRRALRKGKLRCPADPLSTRGSQSPKKSKPASVTEAGG